MALSTKVNSKTISSKDTVSKLINLENLSVVYLSREQDNKVLYLTRVVIR